MKRQENGAADAFAKTLRDLYEAAGKPTYAALIRQGKLQRPPIELAPSTLSSWLRGASIPSNNSAVQFLVNYLQTRKNAVLVQFPARSLQWWEERRLEAWREQHSNRGGRPSRQPEAMEQRPLIGQPIGDLSIDSAFAFEVHRSMDLGLVEVPPLPPYLSRTRVDDSLRKCVRHAENASKMVLVVGEAFTGKTRACWEAIREVLPGWRIWHPLSPDRPQAILNAIENCLIPPRTVIWINDAQLYLSPLPLGNQVASVLQELLADPHRGPVLILGSLRSDYMREFTAQTGKLRKDPHAAARALLRQAECIPIPTEFSHGEIEAVSEVFEEDQRLAEVSRCAVQGHITQLLAGAPIPPDALSDATGQPIDALRTGNEVRDKRENIEFWPSFPYLLAQEVLSSSTQKVRILQTWVNDIQPFLGSIHKSLDSGSEVEILVLDPKCQVAKMRAQNLGISDPSYPESQMQKLLSDLEQLLKTRRDKRPRCEIRTYRYLPSLQMYGTEEVLIIGVFWSTAFSLQGPQIEIATNDSVLGSAARREFEQIWSSSKPVQMKGIDEVEP